MEPFNVVKKFVVNYRFESCCCIAPVRVGLIILEFLSVISEIVCVLGTSNESFNSTFMVVQGIILEDSISKSVPMLVYMIDMSFSVVCLCALFRKDVALLRLYLYYCVAMAALSILFYSVVIAVVDVLVHIAIICEISLQIYVLLLVRSAIVELKLENKQSVLPTLVMRSQVYEKRPQNEIHKDDIEQQNDQELITSQNEEQRNNSQDVIKSKNEKHKEPTTEEENIGNKKIPHSSNVETATEHSVSEKTNGHKCIETKLETVNVEAKNDSQ